MAPLAVLPLALDKPSDIALKKADFTFPSRYQLQIDSWLGMRPCVHSALPPPPAISYPQCWDHLPVLGTDWSEPVQVCVCVSTVSVSSYVFQS